MSYWFQNEIILLNLMWCKVIKRLYNPSLLMKQVLAYKMILNYIKVKTASYFFTYSLFSILNNSQLFQIWSQYFTNSVDQDDMVHFEPPHLGLYSYFYNSCSCIKSAPFDNNYFISRIEKSILEEPKGVDLQQYSSVFSRSTITSTRVC